MSSDSEATDTTTQPSEDSRSSIAACNPKELEDLGFNEEEPLFTEEEVEEVLREEGVELPNWRVRDVPKVYEELLYIAQHHNGSKHTIPDRLRAATAFMVLGSSRKVSKYTGIPAVTVRSWYKTPWWKEAISETKDLYGDQLDAMMTQTLINAQTQLLDRVRNGDEVLTKDGEIFRKKMSGRELATVVGIQSDKRALLRGDPQNKLHNQTATEALADIAKTLSQAVINGGGQFRVPELIEDAEYEELEEDEETAS